MNGEKNKNEKNGNGKIAKKSFREALKGEVNPLLIGLRNELKEVGKKLDIVIEKKPPEVQKTEIVNPEPDIKKVEVTNQKEYPKEIQVKGFVGHLKAVITTIESSFKFSTTWVIDELKSLGKNVFKVKVENQPDVQKVKVINQQKQPEPLDKVKITNSRPSEAIPVVLTSKDRKRFYEMLVSLGGGGGNNFGNIKEFLGLRPFHQYSEIIIAGTAETTMVTLTVPSGNKILIRHLKFGGTGDTDFFFKKNGNIVGHSEITNNQPTDAIELFLDGVAGDIFTITVIQKVGGTNTFRGFINGLLL